MQVQEFGTRLEHVRGLFDMFMHSRYFPWILSFLFIPLDLHMQLPDLRTYLKHLRYLLWCVQFFVMASNCF